MRIKLDNYRLPTPSDTSTILDSNSNFLPEVTSNLLLSDDPKGLHVSWVYMVMHSSFGPPSSAESPHHAFCKWYIYTKHGILSVTNYLTYWAIEHIGRKADINEKLQSEAKNLYTAIYDAANKIKLNKTDITDNVVANIIKNPYRLFKDTNESFLNDSLDNIIEINRKRQDKSIHNFLEYLALHEKVACAFRVAFLCAFLSLEGFVNVVYMLFLKKRYRHKLFSNKLQNEMIPVKILEMDTYCNGFVQQPLSADNELYKAIMHLIDIRNNFLHANISEGMQAAIVSYKGYEIFVKKEKKEKYGIPNEIGNLTNIHILRTTSVIRKFTITVINALNDKYRYPFALVHDAMDIKYILSDDECTEIITDETSFNHKNLEKILSQSTTLDTEYYETKQEEFKPLFNIIHSKF